MGRKGDQSDVLREIGFCGSFRHIYFFLGSGIVTRHRAPEAWMIEFLLYLYLSMHFFGCSKYLQNRQAFCEAGQG